MPGIIVGIDGSSHSRRALDWAISEAAIRHAPLTVLTVEGIAERKEKKMPGIIVGVDGSAIPAAPLTGRSRGSDPSRAAHRAHRPAGHESFWAGPVIYPEDAELAEHARKIAQDETDGALGKLAEDARPPAVTVLAVPGLPAEAILGAAKDADMIVVGSRGAGGFKKLLMGSVASQVTRYAHVPVVVIPAENS